MSAFDQRNQHANTQFNFNSSDKTSNEVVSLLMRQIKDLLPEMPLQSEEKAELTAEIQTVEVQLASPKPKPKILQESLQTIRSILEGVAGNAAYSVIVAGINQFFST